MASNARGDLPLVPSTDGAESLEQMGKPVAMESGKSETQRVFNWGAGILFMFILSATEFAITIHVPGQTRIVTQQQVAPS